MWELTSVRDGLPPNIHRRFVTSSGLESADLEFRSIRIGPNSWFSVDVSDKGFDPRMDVGAFDKIFHGNWSM